MAEARVVDTGAASFARLRHGKDWGVIAEKTACLSTHLLWFEIVKEFAR